ncbi:glycoside hydrolase family 65 [Salipaludibacillus neizhouensis]|uniref:Glycoside hydrolase family 65 n=1 Tax=Salipaludibacillus neizhouensis TaxID=885475 RepID=A0A3A9JWI2_9BACI|nr:glycoside hydrolase family 65 [Salipaludibacillus neizhouensis]RKL65264.1 glycoside hydrolase family 65 [Salipaludibacillus neizhouensis]
MLNRRNIVDRHNPSITKIESLAPLSIGNREFGFSCDFTGLQTFPEAYETPLGTQSNWGWHYTGGPNLYSEKDIMYQGFDTYGRQVNYPMKPEGKEVAYNWLRQNPHRLHLGRISFRFLRENNQFVQLDEITGINQKLDLWTGIVESEFFVEGVPVQVKTACHADHDVVAVQVSSPLIKEKRIQVFTLFPAPDVTHNSWSKATQPDWDNDDRHQTEYHSHTDKSVLLTRKMDQDQYDVRWDWNNGSLQQTGEHEYTLIGDGSSEFLEFAVSYAPKEPPSVKPKTVFESSRSFWEAFWLNGGALDFSGSTDPRATELERRVVLSQYLSTIHSAGSLPPQETGFMYNSWFGKFHLEMHWWHGAHFPLWGRKEYVENSLEWYQSILPLARELAESQGYAGARWPKMVGIDGKQSPSPVAPGLIWQQPHPMALAEMCYLVHPTTEFLKRFQSIVFEAADFMVSYAHWNEKKEVYVLGPPLIPAQECHYIHDSLNPPYELEYWKYGLEIAISWANRLNLPVNPMWSRVANSLAKPRYEDGVYLAHENCLNTFTEKNHDHPSMLGALGILPGTLVDPEIMRNTLYKVKKVWNWESAWGWDFPMCAMTATRLGERELALDFLLMDATKNTYLVNGHNYQRSGLTAYLPGNGGLLTAVAMMVCGWKDGSDHHCPGFPQDGSWSVKWEGLHSLL